MIANRATDVLGI